MITNLFDCRYEYLIEVEDQIQFADIMEVFIKNFNEVMNGFEIYQIVVIDVDTDAEVEPRISSIHYLKIAELLPKEIIRRGMVRNGIEWE